MHATYSYLGSGAEMNIFLKGAREEENATAPTKKSSLVVGLDNTKSLLQ